MTKNSIDIESNLAAAQERLELALDSAGRAPDACQIVAVTKRQATEKIAVALAGGARCFGENRIQEAKERWPELKERFSDVELHLIGGLQTNKVKEAVTLFDVIETVDRPKLARALAREMERSGRRPRLFIQVNTGDEPQKGGVTPGELEGLIMLCRGELGLEIEGLMCLPPFGENPAPHFAALVQQAARYEIPSLSMGMSDDFELAAGMGADFVRIGTAIFGPRSEI
jgi:pyridoxal phosphate enzyme (YggS family)